jgi:hypothetical protein
MSFTIEELADVLLNGILFPLREGLFETPYTHDDFYKPGKDIHSSHLDDLYNQLERLQTLFDQALSSQYPKVAEKFQVEIVYSRFGQILFYISKKNS